MRSHRRASQEGQPRPHCKTADGQTHEFGIDAISEALHAYGFEHNVETAEPPSSPSVTSAIGTHTLE